MTGPQIVMMAVFKKKIIVVLCTLKKFSKTAILKLFAEQAEVSALPVGYSRKPGFTGSC